MTVFEGIIDVYAGNAPNLDDAWNRGVRVLFWETGRGLCDIDGKYKEMKKKALAKGFLWCAYHLVSGEDYTSQLDRFLSIEDGTDPRVGMALDWEKCCDDTTLGFSDMKKLIQLFNARMKPRYPDRYPILYGGWTVRETKELQKGDPVFARCPLWYQHYKPVLAGIPAKTWPTYTFWQYDDEKRRNGAPPAFAVKQDEDKIKVLSGADWNRFQGSLDDLKKVWPFSGAPVA